MKILLIFITILAKHADSRQEPGSGGEKSVSVIKRLKLISTPILLFLGRPKHAAGARKDRNKITALLRLNASEDGGCRLWPTGANRAFSSSAFILPKDGAFCPQPLRPGDTL